MFSYSIFSKNVKYKMAEMGGNPYKIRAYELVEKSVSVKSLPYSNSPTLLTLSAFRAHTPRNDLRNVKHFTLFYTEKV